MFDAAGSKPTEIEAKKIPTTNYVCLRLICSSQRLTTILIDSIPRSQQREDSISGTEAKAGTHEN